MEKSLVIMDLFTRERIEKLNSETKSSSAISYKSENNKAINHSNNFDIIITTNLLKSFTRLRTEYTI